MGSGLLACVFSQPANGPAGAATGAKAGAIAAVGSLLGQMIGTAVMGATVDQAMVAEAAAEMSRLFGVTVTDPELYAEVYTPMLLVGNLLCGLLGIALGGGFGAVGGFLWHQFRKQAEEITAPSAEA
jgi:hypothetical protein